MSQRSLLSSQGDPSHWGTMRSSGVTGEPVEVTLDKGRIAADEVALASFIDRALTSVDWRQREYFHVVLHPGAKSLRTPANWSSSGSVAKWNLANVWQMSDSDFVSALRRLDKSVIAAMPSVAEMIAHRIIAAELERPCQPALMLLSGESVSPSQRNTIRGAFRCPLAEVFAVAEIGIVGFQCQYPGRFHVVPDTTYAEILTSNGRATVCGEAGDLVLTSLSNRAMPIIRYRTGDRVRWAAVACSCGSKSRLSSYCPDDVPTI